MPVYSAVRKPAWLAPSPGLDQWKPYEATSCRIVTVGGSDIMERGGFGAVMEAAVCPDAIESIRAGIRAVVGMYASQRDVLRALNSMAQLDAEAVGGSVQKLEERRAIGMASRARRLAEQGALRPDVTEAQAANLLWLLTSFDAFDLLYSGRAMPVEEVADTLIATAERTLCRGG